jgi:hypothetical protein
MARPARYSVVQDAAVAPSALQAKAIARSFYAEYENSFTSKRNKKVAHIWQDQQNFLLGTHQNQFGQRYYSECEPPTTHHSSEYRKTVFFSFSFFLFPRQNN